MSSTRIALSLVTILLAGCGGADLGSCPSNSETQQTAGATVLSSKCATCHSASGGKAGGLAFDDASTVKSNAQEMYSAAEAGDMPPNGSLSSTDIEALRVYLACQ